MSNIISGWCDYHETSHDANGWSDLCQPGDPMIVEKPQVIVPNPPRAQAIGPTQVISPDGWDDTERRKAAGLPAGLTELLGIEPLGVEEPGVSVDPD